MGGLSIGARSPAEVKHGLTASALVKRAFEGGAFGREPARGKSTVSMSRRLPPPPPEKNRASPLFFSSAPSSQRTKSHARATPRERGQAHACGSSHSCRRLRGGGRGGVAQSARSRCLSPTKISCHSRAPLALRTRRRPRKRRASDASAPHQSAAPPRRARRPSCSSPRALLLFFEAKRESVALAPAPRVFCSSSLSLFRAHALSQCGK